MENNEIDEIIDIDEWSNDLGDLRLDDRITSPDTALLLESSLQRTLPFHSANHNDVIIVRESGPIIIDDRPPRRLRNPQQEPPHHQTTNSEDDVIFISSSASSSSGSPQDNANTRRRPNTRSQARHNNGDTILTVGQHGNHGNVTTGNRVVIRNRRDDNRSTEQSNNSSTNTVEPTITLPYHSNPQLHFEEPSQEELRNRLVSRVSRRHRLRPTRAIHPTLIVNGIPLPNPRLPGFTDYEDLSFEDLVRLSDQVDLIPGQGLSPDRVEELTLTSTFDPVTDASPDRSCSICLIEFQPSAAIRILPCFHRYHVTCIDEWLGRKAQCPVCRTDVVNPRFEGLE